MSPEELNATTDTSDTTRVAGEKNRLHSTEKRIARDLEEIGNSLLGLLKVELLRLRLRFRERLWSALLGFMAGIVALVATVIATRYAMLGLAGGLAELFGDRPWAGMLATGAGFFLALGFGLKLWRTRSTKRRVLALEKSLGQTTDDSPESPSVTKEPAVTKHPDSTS